MLQEADSDVMTRTIYQTTWRWDSRGRRRWGENDTAGNVSLGFTCDAVFMGFVFVKQSCSSQDVMGSKACFEKQILVLMTRSIYQTT